MQVFYAIFTDMRIHNILTFLGIYIIDIYYSKVEGQKTWANIKRVETAHYLHTINFLSFHIIKRRYCNSNIT